MDDIFDPRIYKAWNEAIIKEKKIRVKWYEEYAAKVARGEIIEEVEIPSSTPDAQELKKVAWPRTGATGTCTITRVGEQPSEMIAPSTSIKTKLFMGISHDGKGRIDYLKRRYKTDPEERYHRPVCSSWKHGWRHGHENELSCMEPEKCNIRQKAFIDP